MNRGSLLLALGMASVVATFAGPGCSSSSSGGAATNDGGVKDSSASGDTGSSSGGDTGTGAETAAETGSSSGGGDTGTDAPTCPALSQVTLSPGLEACANANCCTPFTTCFADNACVAVAECFSNCEKADGGTQACLAQCEPEATTAGSEFNAAVGCIAQCEADGG
jgi:hypothetical protein